MNVRPHVARKALLRRHRRAHYPTPKLRPKPARPQTDRRGVRWIKTIAGLRKTRFIGRAKTALAFTFAAAAYNLVRLPKLIAEAA